MYRAGKSYDPLPIREATTEQWDQLPRQYQQQQSREAYQNRLNQFRSHQDVHKMAANPVMPYHRPPQNIPSHFNTYSRGASPMVDRPYTATRPRNEDRVPLPDGPTITVPDRGRATVMTNDFRDDDKIPVVRVVKKEKRPIDKRQCAKYWVFGCNLVLGVSFW